jgi:hypothetical protein
VCGCVCVCVCVSVCVCVCVCGCVCVCMCVRVCVRYRLLSLHKHTHTHTHTHTLSLFLSPTCPPFPSVAHTQFVTLRPGDLIFTGTPPGVGCFRKPPLWLKVRAAGVSFYRSPQTSDHRSVKHEGGSFDAHSSVCCFHRSNTSPLCLCCSCSEPLARSATWWSARSTASAPSPTPSPPNPERFVCAEQ